MLRVSDILFGVRNLLLVSLCLLLISALLASLFDLASLSYPANAVTNLALWVGVLVGSYATTRNLPRMDQDWLFGGIVGGVYGVVVFVVMAVLYNITGTLSGQSLLGLLPIIVLYAVLGLIGAFVGGTGGARRDYYFDR